MNFTMVIDIISDVKYWFDQGFWVEFHASLRALREIGRSLLRLDLSQRDRRAAPVVWLFNDIVSSDWTDDTPYLLFTLINKIRGYLSEETSNVQYNNND